MNYYCTLDEARSELKASENTLNDNRLLRYIRIVSRRIDQIMTGRSNLPYFMPSIKTFKVPISGDTVSRWDNTLLLPSNLPPLLEITSVTADGTSVTSVVEGYPQGEPYISQLRITSSGSAWYSYLASCDPGYAEITGIWGYHSDYANAWLAVDALAVQQLSGAASFQVADIDGADPYGITPRLSPGALVKVESEFELVTDIDTATNIATATRSQNGSTAATHAISSAVYWWQVEEPIKRVTARQAGLLIARQGAYQVETLDGVGVVTYPQDLLSELRAVLQEYINR